MRTSEKLFIVGLTVAVAGLGWAGNALGKMALSAQVAQVTYLCETGDERACHKLAQWTGGDCASPRMIGGCRADSYVYVKQ